MGQHVVGSCQGKDKEEEDEDAGLQAICSHTLRGEQDGAHQPALGSLKASTQHQSQAAAIRGPAQVQHRDVGG